jgi:CMP-N,N'-diacetyllegionaminic acid synthase
MLPNGTTVVALVPARGGSKGIPRKNLSQLAGKPLIAHTIIAAQQAALVDVTWVSSDDEEILKFSASLGAQTLIRPTELADDCASADGVVHHFLASLPDPVRQQDAVIVYLQPTSPLRDETHIDRALEAMELAKADGVMSVVEANKAPQKAFRLDENGRLKSLFDERLSNARRQDLPRCFYPNGAIYAFRISAFLSRQGFPSNGSIPFIMSYTDSIDIDTAADLTRAEVAIGEKNGRI